MYLILNLCSALVANIFSFQLTNNTNLGSSYGPLQHSNHGPRPNLTALPLRSMNPMLKVRIALPLLLTTLPRQVTDRRLNPDTTLAKHDDRFCSFVSVKKENYLHIQNHSFSSPPPFFVLYIYNLEHLLLSLFVHHYPNSNKS